MEEVRWYFAIYFGAVLLMTANLTVQGGNILHNFHHAAFQAASVMTTTGYSTTDFNLWPSFSKAILLTLMFIGACAGSTGGGIKVSRVVIYMKSVKKEMAALIHPRSVKVTKLEGKVVDDTMLRSVFAFLSAYLVIFVISLLVVSLDGFNLETNFSAVAATFNNIGTWCSRSCIEFQRLFGAVKNCIILGHADWASGNFPDFTFVCTIDVEKIKLKEIQKEARNRSLFLLD